MSKTPNGIRNHVIDLVLKEFSDSCSEKGISVDTDTFLEVFQSFFGMAMNEDDEHVR